MATTSTPIQGDGQLRHLCTREGMATSSILSIYISKEWDGDLLHGMGWPPPPFSIYI